MSDEKEFAFGAFKLVDEGVACPIAEAEPLTNSTYGNVIEEFDHRAKKRTGEVKGTLPESEAKDIWLQMIEHFNNDYPFSKYHEETAKEVAEKLGWLE